MHPILSRRRNLALFVAAWLLAAIPVAMMLRAADQRPWGDALLFAMPMTVVFGFVTLSAWWVCRSNPLNQGDALKPVLAQLGAALQSSAVWTGLSALWAVLLSARFGIGPDRAGIVRDVVTLFVAGIPLYLLSAVVHYLFLAFEASRAAERLALESTVVARDAELRALRAQLHPHFLFNSLNSINALVVSDPEGARRMCEGLGDFFRRTLQLAARDSVPLADELSLVERYLSIERVRFGDRLGTELTIAPGAERCLVPPLLLQPLVENAVKHGISERLEGGVIAIRATRVGDRLVLRVENPCDDGPSRSRGEGVGLENVRRRLLALDRRGSSLGAKREGETFRVELELPAIEAAPGVAAPPRGREGSA